MRTSIFRGGFLVLLLLLSNCASSTQNETSTAAPDSLTTTTPMGPSSARLTATVVGYEAVDGGYHCTLRVGMVHAYGAGTPPLASGSEIVVLMRETFFGEEMDAASYLRPDTSITLALQHARVPAGVDAPAWRATQRY